MQLDGFNSALSPVVYGDIALSINTHYITLHMDEKKTKKKQKQKNKKKLDFPIYLLLCAFAEVCAL